MRFRFGKALLIVASGALAAVGCSKADLKDDAVATVNGDAIKVTELREFLGYRGGMTSAADVPIAMKKEALDRLIAGRLLAQEGLARGLDNTDEFKALAKQNESSVLIAALFRKEVASKLKVSSGDVKDEAKKLREADKSMSEDNASIRAGRMVSEKKLKKIEEDLVVAARKEVPSKFNEDAIAKIGKPGAADGLVLATVGADNVSYGDVKKILNGMSGGNHGGQDLATNPVAVRRVLEREMTGKVLAAYARKSGIEGSEWAKSVRRDMERSIAIDLLAEKDILKNIQVTDKDIQKAYAEHANMFVRQDGKKIPLSQVKEQLVAYLRNVKQKAALDEYVQQLKKKAKITVNEELLPKV